MTVSSSRHLYIRQRMGNFISRQGKRKINKQSYLKNFVSETKKLFEPFTWKDLDFVRERLNV